MSAPIAILLGLVVLYVVTKLALGMAGVAVAVALTILSYFIARQVIGQVR